MSVMPGGGVAKRPLHFIILADCSGSMTEGGKIQALNAAVEELLPHLDSVTNDNIHADILVRAIAFSTGSQWHVEGATRPADLRWPPLQARGTTDLGGALRLVAQELMSPPMPERAFPPALLLISDGRPTDDFASGLVALEGSQWGGKAQRFAVAIGSDADKTMLARFVGDPEIPVLEARNAEHLKNLLQFVSTVAMHRSLPAVGTPHLPPIPAPTHTGHGATATWV